MVSVTVINMVGKVKLTQVATAIALKYRVLIENPEHHIVRVSISGLKGPDEKSLKFFIPSWSPGSYLMREYGRNIRLFKAQSRQGQTLYHRQIHNGVYEVFWNHGDFSHSGNDFVVSYEIFCHECSVRTSLVDISHAFLHGPSFLMGILDKKVTRPSLELVFPPSWSKVTTSLKDISKERSRFLYEADDYDHLLDCPIEIGCHETDGFMHQNKEHHLSFYGNSLPHGHGLKADIKKIVETVSGYFSRDTL